MTTVLQTTANGRNALQSTGPKTKAGKARSAQNALCHGLRSALPVLPGERPEDWEAHRAGILQSLGAVGALETELAGRVAVCLWRLRRVATYETVVTAVGLEEVGEDLRKRDRDKIVLSDEKKPDTLRLAEVEAEISKKREVVDMWVGTLRLLQRLPKLSDDKPVDGDDAYGVFVDVVNEVPEDIEDAPDVEDDAFPASLGVPADYRDEGYAWPGWTAGMVKNGMAKMARAAKLPAERLLARAVERRCETQAKNQAEVTKLEREARELRRRIKAEEDHLRRRRMLPDDHSLDKITRYEAHLSRQMLQALHTLERLQAARGGQPVPPPAALDVTVDAPLPIPGTEAGTR
jgi:hypothetical protein